MKYPKLLKPTQASKSANVATTQLAVSVIMVVLLLYNNLLTQRQTRNYTSNSGSQKVKNGYECGSNICGGSSSGLCVTDWDRCGKSHMSSACCAYGRTCRGCGRLGTIGPAVSLVVLDLGLVMEPALLREVLHSSNQRALSVSTVWVCCLNVGSGFPLAHGPNRLC